MRSAREQLLAGAGLTGDQDAAVGCCNVTDGLECIDDLLRLADDLGCTLGAPGGDVEFGPARQHCDSRASAAGVVDGYSGSRRMQIAGSHSEMSGSRGPTSWGWGP